MRDLSFWRHRPRLALASSSTKSKRVDSILSDYTRVEAGSGLVKNMKYFIYWLINERETKTYVGISADLSNRLKQHRNKQVNTTKEFGNFKYYIIEIVEGSVEAREREKYWKSSAGRKKLKRLFKIKAPSSSG